MEEENKQLIKLKQTKIEQSSEKKWNTKKYRIEWVLDTPQIRTTTPPRLDERE